MAKMPVLIYSTTLKALIICLISVYLSNGMQKHSVLLLNGSGNVSRYYS